MPGGITLLESLNSDIPAPPFGKVTVYFSIDLNTPAYKDSAGIVHTMQGTTGSQGTPGTIGIQGVDGDEGDLIAIPGPQGVQGITGAQGPVGPVIIGEDFSIDENILSSLLPYDGVISHYYKGNGTLGSIQASDVPTLNQNTTGSAAKLTTARTIAGVSFNGTANISIASSNLSDGTNIALDNNNNNFSAQQILQKGIAIKGFVTPAALSSGNNNDYDPGPLANIFGLRVSGDGAGGSIITGLAGGVIGMIISIINVGTDIITLNDNDLNSSAGNRFRIGSNIILNSFQSKLIWYDPAISQWTSIG